MWEKIKAILKQLPPWLIGLALVLFFVLMALAYYSGQEFRANCTKEKGLTAGFYPRHGTTAEPGMEMVIFADPKLADLAKSHLGKTKLIYSRRKVNYSIAAIDENTVTLNAQNDLEVSNRSNNAIEEELPIRLTKHYPEPEVLLDGVAVTPLKVTGTTPDEIGLLYRITIPAGETKRLVCKVRELKEPFPFREPDVTLLTALYSELSIEGSPELMNRLNVEAMALTWRDNWEKVDLSRANRTVFLWRSKGPLFPYQGAFISVRLK